ncbi:C40 family peptidase [uncultured Akkermansia sp.]|uniref:C40 family peptidase n=1 Tax=uncultured Akkermansia sp. TaxID=512294 RepID=UPI0025FB2544|nr:C40 family peptidase [uncultured Akkermansia sp.]
MRQEDEPGGGEPSGREPEGSGSDNRTDRRQKEKNSDAESEKFRKAQEKADRAGKKLHTARDKLDKAQAKQAAKKPPGLARKAVRGARAEAWFYVHNKIHQVEQENVGVEGAHKSELVTEGAARRLTRYAKRRYREHPARRVAKWERKEMSARADLDFQKMAAEHPELASSPLSRIQQKWKLKRKYAKEAKAAAKQSAKAAKKAAASTGSAAKRAGQFAARHPAGVLLLLLLFLVFAVVASATSLFTTVGGGLSNAVSGTSYASEDDDLLGADEDYSAMERELSQTVANIERDHPGYDEYRYSVDEIGHNPYELASYLSAKYHVYTREQVQAELREIFEAQYELTLTEEVEIRYRTETSTDPETGETTSEEVPYEYYILNVTLKNRTLPAVILPRMDEQQKEIYTIMQELKGNKPYLWEGIYTEGGGPGPTYEIPGEALSDPSFAALMAEATKYIGYPYVWGGSNPSTSFDCSGFVCWVYTASGVHNLPRTTAQGIYNQCAIIPSSEAKPGDIIFFTGTYDSPGPVSHVGIYVGDNKMLHCGDPIQYADITSSYWTQHFYAFGRLS